MAPREQIDVTPEPSPEVAEAIAAALRPGSAEPEESAWWRAGVEESLRDDPEP